MVYRRIILYILIIALICLAILIYHTHTTQPIETLTQDGATIGVMSYLFFGLLLVTLCYLMYHISLVQKDQVELRNMFNKYIRDQLKKGSSQKSIKMNLHKVGWNEEDVKKRIDKVKKHIKR